MSFYHEDLTEPNCLKCGIELWGENDGYCRRCEDEYEARRCEICDAEMSYHPGKYCPTCLHYEFGNDEEEL